MELYHKVLQRDPGHAAAHYNLGQIYTARKQFAPAQWEYEAALKADPQSVDARLNLGGRSVLAAQVPRHR
jgi:Tfp pilus assembly protein PilF